MNFKELFWSFSMSLENELVYKYILLTFEQNLILLILFYILWKINPS